MTLAERLEEESRGITPGPECGVAVFLAALADDDRAELTDVLSRTATIKSSVVQRAIKTEYEVYVSISTIQRHRNGQCKCARRN